MHSRHQPGFRRRGAEITRALNAFLGTLTQENRRLFVRRYWYVDTVAEIAQRYNMSESKVKTRLHRIREKLRVYLMQEELPYDGKRFTYRYERH